MSMLKRHFLMAENRSACGIVKPIGMTMPAFVILEGEITISPTDPYPKIPYDAVCANCYRYATKHSS